MQCASIEPLRDRFSFLGNEGAIGRRPRYANANYQKFRYYPLRSSLD
ncbi:MAG: hypothetical protein F6K50_02075 [Moorea sp. SIO3I7]|nr:hypothetical protein [Moorena sp. SIO3I7]